MIKKVYVLVVVLAVGLSLAIAALQSRADEAKKADAARKPIRVLVSSQTAKFVHPSIPMSHEVLKKLAGDSGAIEVTIDNELKHCTSDGLKNFDIIMFVNTTHELKIDDAQKQALLDFVRSGKGFVGVHAATDTFYEWPEYGEMIGGYFDGHPWHNTDSVTIKVEKPENPIVKPFGDKPFELTEEIYQFKAPYDRSKCEVLLSLDTSKTDMTKNGIKRTDGDFAVSWIKPFGKGRVFYTSLGHNEAVWNDPRYQKHLLAGIAWAGGEGKDASVSR
jgi:type 1 glutamine amidotransferase